MKAVPSSTEGAMIAIAYNPSLHVLCAAKTG
jgi:hypothetical protein